MTEEESKKINDELYQKYDEIYDQVVISYTAYTDKVFFISIYR